MDGKLIMATKPKPFEKSPKDNERKAPGKEGSKREERYDAKQSKKK